MESAFTATRPASPMTRSPPARVSRGHGIAPARAAPRAVQTASAAALPSQNTRASREPSPRKIAAATRPPQTARRASPNGEDSFVEATTEDGAPTAGPSSSATRMASEASTAPWREPSLTKRLHEDYRAVMAGRQTAAATMSANRRGLTLRQPGTYHGGRARA